MALQSHSSPVWALKPSLVEWKLAAPVELQGDQGATLKPSLVEWKPGPFGVLEGDTIRLETFLGGMETSEGDEGAPQDRDLETFLGGMETLDLILLRGVEPPLKPSLVEWKLIPDIPHGPVPCALKPSLVEWTHLRRALCPTYDMPP